MGPYPKLGPIGCLSRGVGSELGASVAAPGGGAVVDHFVSLRVRGGLQPRSTGLLRAAWIGRGRSALSSADDGKARACRTWAMCTAPSTRGACSELCRVGLPRPEGRPAPGAGTWSPRCFGVVQRRSQHWLASRLPTGLLHMGVRIARSGGERKTRRRTSPGAVNGTSNHRFKATAGVRERHRARRRLLERLDVAVLAPPPGRANCTSRASARRPPALT